MSEVNIPAAMARAILLTNEDVKAFFLTKLNMNDVLMVMVTLLKIDRQLYSLVQIS
jgi:hypothetical protein